MKVIKNLIKLERRTYPHLDKEKFQKVCDTFHFVKGEYKDLLFDNEELSPLFSHMYMFKNEEGKKYYVANTHAKFEEMVPVLLKHDLLGDVTFAGEGFWDENSTLVVVREKTMKRLCKELEM